MVTKLTELWRIVIIKGIHADSPLELLGIIIALRAQVVDFVAIFVFLLQEHLDLVHRVPEHGLQAGTRGGKAHGNDPVSDVGQVQIVPIVHISSLILAHQVFDHLDFCLNISDFTRYKI